MNQKGCVRTSVAAMTPLVTGWQAVAGRGRGSRAPCSRPGMQARHGSNPALVGCMPWAEVQLPARATDDMRGASLPSKPPRAKRIFGCTMRAVDILYSTSAARRGLWAHTVVVRATMRALLRSDNTMQVYNNDRRGQRPKLVNRAAKGTCPCPCTTAPGVLLPGGKPATGHAVLHAAAQWRRTCSAGNRGVVWIRTAEWRGTHSACRLRICPWQVTLGHPIQDLDVLLWRGRGPAGLRCAAAALLGKPAGLAASHDSRKAVEYSKAE